MVLYRTVLQYIQIAYIFLLPLLANFYVASIMTSDGLAGLYLFGGQIVAIMYFAVRVETIRLPLNIWRATLITIAPYLSVFILLIQQDIDSFLEAIGILVFIELVSLLTSMLLVGVGFGTGRIGKSDSILLFLQKLGTGLRYDAIYNIKSLFFVLIVLIAFLIFIIASFLPLMQQLSVISSIIISIAIFETIIEYAISLYHQHRSNVSYAAIVVPFAILWWVTFIAGMFIYQN